MVLIMVTIWYPHGKAKEVGKKYIELNKKYPPDRSLGKTLVIGVSTKRKGVRTIGILNVVKGKLIEALSLQSKFQREFAESIEGYKYELEVLMDIIEAYATTDMEAPEDR